MLRCASVLVAACVLGAPGCGDGPSTPPGAVTVDVSATFPPGTVLRDGYGGGTATVASSGTVTITPDASGVVLLEKDGAPASPFHWADATVYFVMTDRFANGDTSNDHAYGRMSDGKSEVGTFHGGDFQGLTGKLDYLASLGVSAIWISPIVENVHGWVSGGTGDFKHYAYAGYWALDYTRLDQNLGDESDLQALVDGAHQRGIRVLVDVVMNHPGYATGADLAEYLPEVFVDKTGAAWKMFDQTATTQLNKWNDLVNYNSDGWTSWWSPKWIRAGFPGFDKGGSDDITKQLNFLPDFKTESIEAADVPVLMTRKQDTAFMAQQGFTVRQYLVKWHTDWVRKLGIDGFRCDTAKNVELGSWKALKTAAVQALADWKAANPGKKIDDAPFFTTGEVFPHGVTKDNYYSDGGFDSLINFDFQRNLTYILQTNTQLAAGAKDLEAIYAAQAGAIAGDPTFGILSYISSHDTRLNLDFFQNDLSRQRHAGTALLLAPGGVQVFYGDESGRRAGPGLSDASQVTRSDMNWSTTDAALLEHWRKISLFRKKHAAVGGGTHQRIASPEGTYAFSRKLGDDAVVVIVAPAK